MKPARQVTVTIHGGKEEYDFKGPWSGIDVKTVKVHLSDKYRLYMRSIRRGTKMPIVITEEPVTVVTSQDIEWTNKSVGWEEQVAKPEPLPYPLHKKPRKTKKRSK